jgi:hypothetical protein
MLLPDIAVGDRIRIHRDETRHPSRGTWPQFRGRTGTVVEINLGEYGVVFGKATPRPSGKGYYQTVDAWFQPNEVTPQSRPQALRATLTDENPPEAA